MKKLIKFIIPILFFLSGFNAISQVKFIGTSNRFIVTGRGDVKGIALDNARIVNWSIVKEASFETTVYLESLTTGKAGIIVRDANISNNLNGGRPCYYLYVSKTNNKVTLDVRPSLGSSLVNLLEINNPSSSGLWLNFKKTGTSLISRISTSPKSAIGTQSWIEINTTPENALANYTSFSRGIIVASGSPSTTNAIFSNWKVVNSTPITIPPPIIASSTNPFVVGTASILTSTNCNYIVDWYKNNVFQSSGSSFSVNSPVLNDIYNAKCKNGTNVSFSSNELIVNSIATENNGLVNTLVDRNIPVTAQWNYFNPDLIPDFEQDKNIDSKTGERLPNKWAIYHAPYKSLFGNTQSEQLTKMFKKGWTAINASKIGGAFAGMENIITFDRIVVDGGFANTNGDAPEDASYDNFEAYAQTPFGYASTYNIPKDNTGKWRAFLSDIDYESKYTAMDSQLSANYHVVAFNSGLSITNGRYGFQYAGANNASYITNEIYNGSHNTIWNVPADNTVKPQYQGKALSHNPRFVGRTEVSYYFEEFLPQDYQVKDQDGNNWFRLNHFGAVCATGCGQNTPTNSDNWASHLGAFIEVNHKIHKTLNQDFIIQIKPVNERDNGFKYSEQNRAYYGNKRILEFNRYGTIQPNEGACTGCTFVASMGSEYIPPFIAEAQVFLSYASGAKGISFWSSGFTDIAYPHDKATNQRSGARFDNVNTLNADLDSYIYTMKALWRMNQKVDLGNGKSYSFNEICDGSEIYLNELTKVVYPNSSEITQLRALDWQILRKTPVRAVVNVSKNVVFVVAFQAYASEQDRITFKLTDYGANISQVIDVPAGKVIVKAFPLNGNIAQNNTVLAPSIVSSNNNPTNGQTVNLTSSGCGSNGINKWYDNQEGNYLSSGLVYSTTVVIGNGYYAKCVNTVSNISSDKSNVITFINTQNNPTVTITEPNRAVNYYKSSNGNPQVVNNYVYSTDDVVYMTNDKIKVGFNLRYGGAICYLSQINSTVNMVNNGYDGGRQIQPDYYQKPQSYTQNGKTPDATWVTNGYNTTLGGDYARNTVTLLDYYPITNGYYLKFKPIFWGFPAEISQITIEVTYVLVGNAVKATYKYTSNRTDNQIPDGLTINGWSLPTTHLNQAFTQFYSYTGNAPYTNAPITSFNIPLNSNAEANGTEHWGAMFNPTTGVGVAVYNKMSNNNTYFQVKKEPSDNASSEFSSGFSVLQTLDSYFTPDSHFEWNRTDNAYIIVGNISEIRAKVYQIAGN